MNGGASASPYREAFTSYVLYDACVVCERATADDELMILMSDEMSDE